MFSTSIHLSMINKYDKGSVILISLVLAHLPCCLSKGSLKRGLLDIYLTTFMESVISEIQNLWELSFFWKYSKFKLDFKNPEKNSEKFLCSCGNCILIGIVKLSLLRTEYLTWGGNVLTSSPRIWLVNNIDFFQLNWVGGDQSRW